MVNMMPFPVKSNRSLAASLVFIEDELDKGNISETNVDYSSVLFSISLRNSAQT